MFSVSTLAWDWRRQAEYKCRGGNHVRNEVNFDMFRGKAIHEYLQRRFERKGWIAEMKLSKYLDDIEVSGRRVMIIGHVDLYEPERGIIVELKSSQWSDKIIDSHIVQAGAYAAMMREMTLKVSDVHVIKINSKVIRYTLSEDDIIRGYRTIIERARMAAHEINICLGSPRMDDFIPGTNDSSRHKI